MKIKLIIKDNKQRQCYESQLEFDDSQMGIDSASYEYFKPLEKIKELNRLVSKNLAFINKHIRDMTKESFDYNLFKEIELDIQFGDYLEPNKAKDEKEHDPKKKGSWFRKLFGRSCKL